MRYEEFRPDPALGQVIHRYWFLSGAGAGPVTTPQLQPIVPDGRMEIILNLADRFTRHHRDGSIERQARSLVAGQITRCVVVEPGRAIDLVGVRFQPAGAAAVLPVPAAELRDSIIDSTLVTKHLVGDLAGRLHGTPDVADRVSILDQHFLRLRTRSGEPDAVVAAAATRIGASAGRIRVAAVASELGLSRRTLERRFSAGAGISPKLFARITRFQRAFRLMQAGTPGAWGRLAYRCGYSDQAHLTREFREFAGASPSRFFAGNTTLADFFAGEDASGSA